MGTAIRLEHVSKRFTLHHRRPRSFQELVIGLFQGRDRVPDPQMAGAPVALRKETSEDFWALRDVSFSVAEGQTVGIIGPNGAGKSTVLKLISRIIEPTSGGIEVNGRVGALLELGAGFHPDLTGRENIYLNGSILGLSRAEIERRLDEIIAFAELERFIDMPVKHYSSGMSMRLGFSVAVHTDPEILLVDEVLAVGDASFQRKCLERIDELHGQGVTVLFVSHNPDRTRDLCSYVVWLDQGRLVFKGSAESVVRRYLEHSWTGKELGSRGKESRWGNGKVRIVGVRILDGDGREKQHFQVGDPLIVEMEYQAEERVEEPVFGIAIHRSDGTHITGPNTRVGGCGIPPIDGKGFVRYSLSSLPLLEGDYFVSVSAHNWEETEMYDYHDRQHAFRV
ncbi:MAG: ABC transporter ATP-binding protein, partial [Pirellulaceae bacterium]